MGNPTTTFINHRETPRRMVVSQYRSRLKKTGSRYKAFRKKRQFESGSTPSHTRIGIRKVRIARTLGGGQKAQLTQTEVVNLLDPKTRKFEKVKVHNVTDNPANKHYVRRNIMTKGAIINTDKGQARVTNRPGQEGHVNAILIGK